MNKRIIISLGIFITLLMISTAVLFLILSKPAHSTQKQDAQEIILRFNQEEQNELNEAEASWFESGGTEPKKIVEFFNKSNDLEKLIFLCNAGYLSNPIACLRILAIQKPEEKDFICDQIKMPHCGYYVNIEQCLSNLEDLKSDCKNLFPFIM